MIVPRVYILSVFRRTRSLAGVCLSLLTPEKGPISYAPRAVNSTGNCNSSYGCNSNDTPYKQRQTRAGAENSHGPQRHHRQVSDVLLSFMPSACCRGCLKCPHAPIVGDSAAVVPCRHETSCCSWARGIGMYSFAFRRDNSVRHGVR